MWNQLLFWRLSSWLMCWSYKWTSLRHTHTQFTSIYRQVKAIKTNFTTENLKHKSFRMSLNKMWNQLLFWRLSSWLMCWSYKWTSLRHSSAIYQEVKAIKTNCKTENHKHKSFRMSLNKMWNQLLFWRLSSWLMCWSYKWTSLRHTHTQFTSIYRQVKAIKTNFTTENLKHKSFRMSLNKMWNQLLFWRLSSWLMCWSYKWTSSRHSSAIYQEVKAIKTNFTTENLKHKSFRMSLNKMWNQLLFWKLSSWLMCWSYKWTSLRHSSAIYQEVKAIKTNCKTENHKHKSFRMSLNKMWNQLLFWRLSSWLMCWSYKWTSLRHTGSGADCYEVKQSD